MSVFNNPFKKPNRFSPTGYISFVSNDELSTMTFDDFFEKRVVIRHISISVPLGRIIDRWLLDNPSLVTHSSKYGTYTDGGVEYSISTAYFFLESSYEDGHDGGYFVRPTNSGCRYPKAQSPTMLELWFGLKKKYPEYISSVYAEYADISIENHVKLMHKFKLD